MWIALYLIPAFVVAVVAWHMSRHFQSFDPPSDVTRGLASVAAGALWPVLLVGLAQLQAIRYVCRRLQVAPDAVASDADSARHADPRHIGRVASDP